MAKTRPYESPGCNKPSSETQTPWPSWDLPTHCQTLPYAMTTRQGILLENILSATRENSRSFAKALAQQALTSLTKSTST